MAGIKINQYPLERLTFGDDDYYDIDYWNGTAFETAKIKGSVIKLAIQAGIVSNNLFTADLNLLADRDHTINDKVFKATFNDVANTVVGNWQISGNVISSYLNDTVSLANLTTFRQDKDSFIFTVDGGATPTVFGMERGICALSNNNFGFSFNSNTKIATIGSTNGTIQLGDPSNNTNTFYRDLSTNKYGILYKNFGETSETDATGANYSTLVGTSLVPKKYVDDAIASTPASNISNSDLTQTDLVRTYTRSSASGVSKLRFKGASSSYQFEDAGLISVYTGDADVVPYPGVSISSGGGNTGLISFRGGNSSIQGASSSLFLRGFANNSSFVSLIELGADILINPNNSRILKFCSDKIYFKNSDNNTYYGRINDDVFIWSSQSALPSAIGSEKFSIQEDTLVKGSDNSASTSGFKVTDVNDLSLLEVRNSGILKLQYLPSLSTGVGAGDVWSQNGTLRIGSATANIQTVASATTVTPNADTTKMEIVSALASALAIASPTGTPTEAQELTFRIKDDGTARLVVWDAIFEDYTGSLPNTTVANKTVYVGCKYNAIDTKWDVVAVQNQP